MDWFINITARRNLLQFRNTVRLRTLEAQMSIETKRKSNSVVTVQQTDSGQLVIAVLGVGSITFDPTKVAAPNRAYAELHGWKQRLSDAGAMSRDPETGRPATAQDKYDAIFALAEHYQSGAVEWSRVGGGGGGKSITIEAIARVKDVDYADAERMVTEFADKALTLPDGTKVSFGGDRKKALAFLRDGKAVGEAILAIRAERQPKPKVDADNALRELA